MKVILQSVTKASVTINNQLHNEISDGYLLYVGFRSDDTINNVKKMAQKIGKLRVNADENGKININGLDANKSILSISQFTLYGNTRKGNRPSFTEALNPEQATELYDLFNQELRAVGFPVKTGIFQAEMQIASINNGPLTFIIEN